MLEAVNRDAIDELLVLVAPQWRDAFLAFIETGEAEEPFLAYMDEDANCQRAIERAFRIHAAGFEALAKALEQDRPSVESGAPESLVVSAIDGLTRLPKKERSTILKRAGMKLRSKPGGEREADVKSVIRELEASL